MRQTPALNASLCVRTRRTCDYSDTLRSPPTATEFATLQGRLAELEKRLRSSSENPDSMSATASVAGASSFAT
jgi:hypothetical protein